MKSVMFKTLERLPLIGRLVRRIDMQAAEISNLREAVAYDISLIREYHANEMMHLRQDLESHIESITMRSNAQLAEAERFSNLYESLALRLATLEALHAERTAASADKLAKSRS